MAQDALALLDVVHARVREANADALAAAHGDERANHFLESLTRGQLTVKVSDAATRFELDVKRMKIDALCATGHKWMVARGAFVVRP